jgi:hypothetical protein
MQHSRYTGRQRALYAGMVAVLLVCVAGLVGCTHKRGTLSSPMPTVCAPDPDRAEWHDLHIASGMIGVSVWSPDHSYVAAEVFETESKPDSDGSFHVIIEQASTGKVMHLPPTVHSPFVWLPSGHTLVACNDTGDNETPGLAWVGLDGTIERSVTLPADIAYVQCIAALEADQEVAFIARRDTKDDSTAAVYTTSGTEIETIAESDDMDLDGITCVANERGSRLMWARWEADGARVDIDLYRFDLNSPDKDPVVFKSCSFVMMPGGNQDSDAEVNSVLFSPDGGSVAITAGLLTPGPNPDAGPAYLQGCYMANTTSGNCAVAMTAADVSDDLNTTWSANSQMMACAIAIGGARSLYVWDRNGGLIKTVPYTGPSK